MFCKLYNYTSKYNMLPNSRNAWSEVVGDFKLSNNMLIKSDDRVDVLFGNGYVYDFVCENEGRASLYCENLDKEIHISISELSKLNLDKKYFAQEIAKSLELTNTVSKLSLCDGYFLGSRLLGRTTYSAFLLFDDKDLKSSLIQVLKGVPIVYVINRNTLSDYNVEYINSEKGHIVELHKAFGFDDGNIKNLVSMANTIGFQGSLDVPCITFTKWQKSHPKKRTWFNVKITLEDPDYLLVKYGNHSENFHYTSLPFFTRKAGKVKQKNKIWNFFLSLYVETKYEHDLHKNYLPKLRKFLQNFFEIESDPLPIGKNKIIEPQFTLEVPKHILSLLKKN